MRARINAPVEGDFSSEVRFQYVMQSSSLDSAVQIAQLKPGACGITIRAFNDRKLQYLQERRNTNSFALADTQNCKWVRPQRAAQIEFTEWTPDGYLRQASFTGMRGDKDPRRTVREQRFSSLTIADAASMTKGFF